MGLAGSAVAERDDILTTLDVFASRQLQNQHLVERCDGLEVEAVEAFDGGEPLRRALRQAVRCELYNPSRRSRRPTSPGCVQRSASSRIRSRYSAVNWRRFGLATTSGSGVGLARPALGASSLRSSTPRAGTETSFNVIEFLSAIIGFHLHRPTEIPKVAGVSVMLAERGGSGRRSIPVAKRRAQGTPELQANGLVEESAEVPCDRIHVSKIALP